MGERTPDFIKQYRRRPKVILSAPSEIRGIPRDTTEAPENKYFANLRI
jgi:hypothetical protein